MLSERRPVVIWSMVLVHVLAAVATAVVSKGHHQWPEPLDVVFMGVLMSQVSLLAIWLRLSSRSWQVRITAGILGFAVLWFLHNFSFNQPLIAWHRGEPAVVILSPTASIVIALSLVRSRDTHLQISLFESTCATERLQFSLRGMMLWVTIVAVFLGLGRFLKEQSFSDLVEILIAIPVLAFSFGSIAVAVVWACLGTGNVLQRLAFVVCLALTIAFVVPAYTRRYAEWQMYVACAATITVQVLLMIATLWVCRSCGYRLLRHSVKEEVACQPVA